ncbi:MAG: DNA double-strand break repair nuclease NurA [Chloroflexota bacterium]
MTLNLAAVGKQIRAMAENAASMEQRSEKQLREALAAMERCPDQFNELRQRIESSRTAWPIARPLASPKGRWPLPLCPSDYTVIASDGSQIDPDRHGPVLCYLINVGTATLRYGTQPGANLESEAVLGYEEQDLYITYRGHRMLVEGHVLDGRRGLLESKRLAEKAVCEAAKGPTVAVQDGTLLLRTVEGWGDDYVLELYLEEFLDCLEQMRQHRVAVCSYISRPRSVDVVNLLRLLQCPHPIANCDLLCPDLAQRDAQPCGQLAGLLDGTVYHHWLSSGQRSAVFLSPSPVSLKRYEDHRVCFFYADVGREVARIEVPEWVARNEDHLDLVHAVLYEQAQRGGGYPRALIEAHEKAVISGAERQQFQDLLEASLVRRGIQRRPSEKQRSKRLRGL